MTPKIVGRKYRVQEDRWFFKKGSILTLVYDDGTETPWFSGPVVGGNGNWFNANGRCLFLDPGAVQVESFYIGWLELLPEDYTEPADRTSRIAELEKELEQLKREEAKEVAPWLRFKNGDKVRVSFKGVVASVEHENYVGELQIKVRFAHGKSAWLTHKDVELIEE